LRSSTTEQSSDDLGDLVVSGSYGIVLKLVTQSRQIDDVRELPQRKRICFASNDRCHCVQIVRRLPAFSAPCSCDCVQGVDWKTSVCQVGSGFADVPVGSTLVITTFIPLWVVHAHVLERQLWNDLTLQDMQVLESAASNLMSTQMIGMDSIARTKRILVTDSAGKYCIYDGSAWRTCNNPVSGQTEKLAASYMPTEKTIVLSTESGKVYRSKNNGDTFEEVLTPKVTEKWADGMKVHKMWGESYSKFCFCCHRD